MNSSAPLRKVVGLTLYFEVSHDEDVGLLFVQMRQSQWLLSS